MTSNDLLLYFPKRTILSLGLSAFLIATFVFVQNALVTSVVSVLFILYVLLDDLRNCFYSLLFILPANESLNLFGGKSITIIVITLWLIKIIITKQGSITISKNILTTSAVLILSSIVPLFFGMTDQLIVSIKCLLFFFFIMTVLNYYSRFESFGILYDLSYFIIGMGIAFTGCLSLLHSGLTSLVSYRWGFLPETTINAQGILCAVTIINLLYGLIIEHFGLANLKRVIIVFCTVFGLLTQSRTFLLSIVIGVVLLLVFNRSIRKAGVLLTIVLIVFISSGLLYHYHSGFAQLVDSVLLRFTGVEDVSNGRYVLWNNTITNMTSNKCYLWFGAGNYINAGALNGNDIEAAHNCFLEMWVIYGIVGMICLLLFIIVFLKTCLFDSYYFKFKVIAFVPLISLLSALFFSHHFIGKANTIVFVLSLLPLVMSRDNAVNNSYRRYSGYG